jgi:putative hemolysin
MTDPYPGSSPTNSIVLSLAEALGGPDWAISIAAILLSLATSFLFAGSETAITGMGELRIRKLIDSHQGPRGLLELWLTQPSHVLTTLLAGNTLANILSSALVTSLAIRLAHAYALDPSWTEAAVVASLTFMVLVFAEIAPKTLANNHPERFLPALHVVWWFHWATRWMTRLATFVAMLFVRALGGSSTPTTFQVTEEQIEDMVRIGSESGMLNEEQGDMLQGVFELADLPVRTIMTPRIKIDGLPVDASVEQIGQMITSTQFSRFPVYEKTVDKIVGVFYAKDLVDHMLRGELRQFNLAEHTHEALFVPDSKKAAELLRDFQKGSVHMAIVVDEHGGTAGIVTLEDVLEQLVGEIYDEYDQEESLIRSTGDGSWTVDATAEVRAVAEKIGMDLPEAPGYATVGGFVTEMLGRVPKIGEMIRFDGLLFTVREADDNRVVRVDVEQVKELHEGGITEPSLPRHKRNSGVTSAAEIDATLHRNG